MTDVLTAEAPLTFVATLSTGAPVLRSGPRPDGTGYGPWFEALDLAGGDYSRAAGAGLLLNHEAGRSDLQVGVVEGVRLEQGKLVGVVRFGKSPRAREIAADVQDRIRRQLSIGYSVERYVKTSSRDAEIPTFTAVAWTFLEASVVNIAADFGAQFRSSPTMRFRSMTVEAPSPAPEATTRLRFGEQPNHQTAAPAPAVPDALAAERQRCATIAEDVRALGLDPAMAGRLIHEGVELGEARRRMFQARADASDATMVRTVNPLGGGTGRASWPVSVAGGADHAAPAGVAEAISTAFANRLNPSVELTGAARHYRGMRAAQALGALLEAHGVRPGSNERTIVQRAAALTTSDFPLLLANSVNKALLPALEPARSRLREVAYKDSVRDYRPATRHRVGEFPALLRIREHGEYERGALSEGRETFTVQKFGRVLAVTYEALVNDDLDAIRSATAAYALAAASLEADSLATAITSNPAMSDGVSVYHLNHGTTVASGGALSIATLGAAKAAMRKQTGIGGTILNIEPRYLVVPAALETVALQLVGDLSPVTSAESNQSFRNIEVIAEPRLDAASATAWYLFAGPAVPSLALATLEGEETPFTEARSAFDIDAVEVKVRWSLVAYWADYRSTFRNAGV